MVRIWILASLISSSWTFPSDELALNNHISSLNAQWTTLDSRLRFWILLVVIGVTAEVAVVIVEYLHERSEFLHGIVRPPDPPVLWLYAVGLLGAGLVALGVAGEFFIHTTIGKVEADLRNDNAKLVSLLESRASENERKAAELGVEQALIEQSLSWRTLSQNDEKLLASRVARFKDREFWVLYNNGDAEGATFAWEIATVLHDRAGVNVFSPFGILISGKVRTSFDKSNAQAITGLVIASTTEAESREAAQILKQALSECGFDSVIRSDTLLPKGSMFMNEGTRMQIPADAVSVRVESRPRGPQGEAKLKLDALRRSHAQNSPN
jgi:hypothetical protein